MNKVDHKKLEVIDGITYLVSGIPFISQKKTPYTGLGEGFWGNGIRSISTYYIDGKEEGESQMWNKSGSPMSICNWKKGKQHGLSTHWYMSGSIRQKVMFDSGKVISIKVWKPDGTSCPESGVKDGLGCHITYSDECKEINRAYVENGNYGG